MRQSLDIGMVANIETKIESQRMPYLVNIYSFNRDWFHRLSGYQVYQEDERLSRKGTAAAPACRPRIHLNLRHSNRFVEIGIVLIGGRM
jgi:hypothetical protein